MVGEIFKILLKREFTRPACSVVVRDQVMDSPAMLPIPSHPPWLHRNGGKKREKEKKVQNRPAAAQGGLTVGMETFPSRILGHPRAPAKGQREPQEKGKQEPEI